MVEQIAKSIQDLRALSDLYLNNAISFNELGNCKEKALISLRDSRDKLSIAEIIEPLQSLREVYLEDILSLDEYSVSRGLLMNHIRLPSGSIDSYKEVYSLYKQGLLSLTDLHDTKKEILGEDSDDVRSGNPTNINSLRDTAGISTVNRLRNLIDNDTYVEEEVLIQLQGLTNPELLDLLVDMGDIQDSDNLETLGVFKRLIPIITL